MLLVVKNLPASVGEVRDVGLIPGLGRSPWRRKWQPTPVFMPGEFHGQRSLVGYSSCDCQKSQTLRKQLGKHAYNVSPINLSLQIFSSKFGLCRKNFCWETFLSPLRAVLGDFRQEHSPILWVICTEVGRASCECQSLMHTEFWKIIGSNLH